ncbi:NADH dehydrogenase [ubiquinone] 1 alpha subcomplex subunit 11 [Eurosta solidaginis]|uniref:NADH dehydrogenase [ubiquinone] 1 alpha subcomplex subunit 11 n=1 Tax=Eurosta solidaginis TaxID=178769 RepID=UPI0035312625
MSMLKSFQYYNHPEGQDIFGKMVATNKYAAVTGLFYSVADVLMYSKPKGYLPTLGRIAYIIGPMMGMASAFTLTTYASTNIRGKDDKFNYFLGGFAAGGVYGAWQKNHVSGLVVGLFLGIAGGVKKLSKQEGWEFFPNVVHRSGNLFIEEHDFTLMKDPKDRVAAK